MKKKFLILLIALFVFGLTAGAYAIKLNPDSSNTISACCNMDCCKDGQCAMGGDCCKGREDNCPMKNKQTADTAATDMKNVVVAGGGDSCCKPGADCCKSGSCCKKS